ncbi:MAG: signal peptidase II, partial [Oscillospiraceae bacterium]|nr:signal peptidase II [Oscillospiraceae bacterium]
MQYIGLLIAAVLVGIDRLTKWLVTSNMELKDSIHIIEIGGREVLNLTYYTNDGAA